MGWQQIAQKKIEGEAEPQTYGYNAADDPYAAIRYPGAADGIDRSDQPTYANPYAMDYRNAVKDQYGVDPYAGIIPEIEGYGSRVPVESPAATTTSPVDSGGNGGGSAAPAPWTPAAVPSAPAMSYGSPSWSNTSSPYDALLQQRITELLNTPQEVDPEALYKSSENRAYRLSQQRSEERQRAQMAERASGEGWSDSGGMETQIQGLRSQRGENEAAYMGQLAIERMQANREQLMNGIQIATQSGQFNQSQALQRDLAELDAAIRREQLEQQNSQFGLSLGYNYTALQQQANRDALMALL